jgi:hypothetical protein
MTELRNGGLTAADHPRRGIIVEAEAVLLILNEPPQQYKPPNPDVRSAAPGAAAD